MEDFPEWVPEDVVAYYERVSTTEHVVSTTERLVSNNVGYDYESGLKVLHRCMRSNAMKKAWQAVSRRKGKCEPWRFASSILNVHMGNASLGTSRAPSPDQIAACKRLSEITRNLSHDLARLFGTENKVILQRYFHDFSTRSLDDLADCIDTFALSITEHYKLLKRLTGQPNSKTAKRVYSIRMLSGQVQRLYDQPLHKTVAATCSEMLQEDIDEESVRKLVGTTR